jgi:putative hydrolase of the HAD superfamily
MTAASFLAVGFDLGETLFTYRDTPLSWAELYRPALQHVAAKCGLVLDEQKMRRAETILAAYNTRLHPRTQEVSAHSIFEAILVAWNEDVTQCCTAAIEAFFGFFQQKLFAYPEAEETLRMLRQSGLAIGALTDVPYGMPRAFVLADLATCGLEGLIDRVLTSVDVGFRKPDSRGFTRLVSELNVAPDEMIYVGNEPKDIAGANAAGLRSVLIARDLSHAREFGQWKTITCLTELMELIRAIR